MSDILFNTAIGTNHFRLVRTDAGLWLETEREDALGNPIWIKCFPPRSDFHTDMHNFLMTALDHFTTQHD
jgi:hypothetical protein